MGISLPAAVPHWRSSRWSHAAWSTRATRTATIGGPELQNQQMRDFPILQATTCHIPSRASLLPERHRGAAQRSAAQIPDRLAFGSADTISLDVERANRHRDSECCHRPCGHGGEIKVYPSAGTNSTWLTSMATSQLLRRAESLSLYILPLSSAGHAASGGAFDGELTVNVPSPCEVPTRPTPTS